MRIHRKKYRLGSKTYRLLDEPYWAYEKGEVCLKAMANTNEQPWEQYTLIWHVDWQVCLLTGLETALITKEPNLRQKSPDAVIKTAAPL